MRKLWATLIGILAVGAAQPLVLAGSPARPFMSVRAFRQSSVGYRSRLLLPPSVTAFELDTRDQEGNRAAGFSMEKLQPIANTLPAQSGSSLAIPFLPSELVDAFAVNAKPSSPRINPIDFFQVPPLNFNAKVRIGRD